MINLQLAAERDLSNSQIYDLIALHVAMDAMVMQVRHETGIEPYNKGQRKQLRRAVRRLEYQMQDKWGWDRDKRKHFHWKRFNCLVAHPPKWYKKMYPPREVTADDGWKL